MVTDNTLKFVATIEARMTSSRLPEKVLMPALGRPMLHHLVARLRAVPSIDEIVLATTTNATDDPLVEFANKEKLRVFRGSEDDVMARVIGAAEFAGADVIVEITGDCPIIDPDIVEQTIRVFKAHGAAYASNGIIRSYPNGMDTQVFSLEALKRSAAMTNDPQDREHVSLHMCKHPELFPHVHLIAPPSLHWPELGLTLDESADYDLLKKIIEYFGESRPLFSCLDVINLLHEKPKWVEINSAVKRKGSA
jgi:spore coat polysaccharide biosynthesis protein SpsF